MILGTNGLIVVFYSIAVNTSNKFSLLPGDDNKHDPNGTLTDEDDNGPVAMLKPEHVGKNIPMGAKLTLGICKHKTTTTTINNINLYNMCHECKVEINLGPR